MPNKPTTLRDEWEEKWNDVCHSIIRDLLISTDPLNLSVESLVGSVKHKDKIFIKSILTSHNTELLQKIEGKLEDYKENCINQRHEDFIKGFESCLSLITQEK